MLNALREGAKSGVAKFILFGLMTLAVLGLVLTDAGGFFRSGFGRSSLVSVGDIDMTVPQFTQLYNRELRNSGIPPQQARQMGLPQVILAREINRQIMIQAAHQSGIRVDDVAVAKAIRQQMRDAGMNVDDAGEFQMVLRQMGMNEAQLVNAIRADIATQLLSMANAGAITPSRAAIEAMYQYQNEKRVAQIISIDPSTVQLDEPIANDSVQEYYDNNRNAFTTPEKRSVKMIVVTPDSIGDDITISNDDAKRFYSNNKADYRRSDRYQFEQVIFDTSDTANTFVESNESAWSNEDNYVANDWYPVDSLPAELEEALSDANSGDIVGPIETSLGFHVVKINDVETDSYTLFDDVSDDITAFLRDRAIDNAIYGIPDELDGAVADGLSLNDIAEQYNTSPKTISDITPGGPLPNNFNQEIMDMIFVMESDEISPVMDMPDGGYALIQITDIDASDIQSFDTVKNDILDTLKKRAQFDRATTIANEIILAYQDNQTSFNTLARQYNMPYRQTRSIPRIPTEGSALTTAQTNILFSLTETNDVSSVKSGDTIDIIRLADVVTRNNVPTSGDDIDAIKAALTQTMQNEWQQEFVQQWKEKIGVNINVDLFQQAFLTDNQAGS